MYVWVEEVSVGRFLREITFFFAYVFGGVFELPVPCKAQKRPTSS
jgi:hypothetical protein